MGFTQQEFDTENEELVDIEEDGDLDEDEEDDFGVLEFEDGVLEEDNIG